MGETVFLRCIQPACGASVDLGAPGYECPRCGALLDVAYDWGRSRPPTRFTHFQERWRTRNDPLNFSGVWRFRELLPFAAEADLVTIGEGQTVPQAADAAA